MILVGRSVAAFDGVDMQVGEVIGGGHSIVCRQALLKTGIRVMRMQYAMRDGDALEISASEELLLLMVG